MSFFGDLWGGIKAGATGGALANQQVPLVGAGTPSAISKLGQGLGSNMTDSLLDGSNAGVIGASGTNGPVDFGANPVHGPLGTALKGAAKGLLTGLFV